MNNLKYYLTFIAFLLFLSCNQAIFAETNYTVWTDKSELLESMDKDAKVVETFKQGDEVTFLGKRSKSNYKAKHHGKFVYGYWLLVHKRYLPEDKGWVFEGTLKPKVQVKDRLLHVVTDKDGKYLIYSQYTPKEFVKEKVTKALFPNGVIQKVQYVPSPTAKVKTYHKQIGLIPGGYYETVGNTVNATHFCFLYAEPFLQDREILKYTLTKRDPLPKNLKTKIEKEKQRQIDKSWHKATIKDVGELYFVLFKHQGNQALASLVLINNSGKISYQDYPAEFDPKEEYPSIWRVDDGGAINPLDFDIVNYFKTKDGIEMMIFWDGPEGTNIQLVREAGNIFYPIYRDYIIRAY